MTKALTDEQIQSCQYFVSLAETGAIPNTTAARLAYLNAPTLRILLDAYGRGPGRLVTHNDPQPMEKL